MLKAILVVESAKIIEGTKLQSRCLVAPHPWLRPTRPRTAATSPPRSLSCQAAARPCVRSCWCASLMKFCNHEVVRHSVCSEQQH